MSVLEERLAAVNAAIADAAREVGRDPGEITLEAATKTQTADTVRAAIQAGVAVCGENRVQELVQKLDAFAYDGAREVHFIGHLQTNKVRQVVGRVDLIESVDSLHLLQAVSDCAQRLGRVQDILLEVNIAGEASKSGFTPDGVFGGVEKAQELPGVRLRGIMCIPPAAQDVGGNRKFFRKTYQIYVDIISKMVDNREDLSCLSMGMSRDFADAVREGATLVRVGTGLFGPRG
ncbi:MAG: YggS family pyridoxal phosphate-dependent enzyme [Oscillospiraceae bacterium]|jgi:hypothetical protein